MTLVLAGPEALARRGALAARGGDLGALAARLDRRLEAVLAHPLYVPEAKALLSRWGAHCRDDEAPLAFDPFAPAAQRCSRCGRIWSTGQSHRWWAYWYQLWLAEQALALALLGGAGGRPAATARAVEILAAYADRYLDWPNADNVLGPSRPFFSTYLEAVWVLQLAAATATLEATGHLPARLSGDLRERLFAPSAELIADFDEGRSNRQVWNATARYALALLLDRPAEAREATHGPSGVLTVAGEGLLDDGLWFEGENYHWFALRGLAWAAELLREGGELDLWRDPGALGGKFRAAFRAPVLTALPDFTFPARRDSRFGVSLRQRRMAELWELALARSDEGGADEAFLGSLLGAVYDPAFPAPEESLGTVTEIERGEPESGARRDALGWKGWLWMREALPATPPEAWRPGTALLEATGLAIVRRDAGTTYLSLDYGEPGGGHGHPDRLNLTLVARGVPWLLDFGTGSYVAPTLGWYRSTLAHNAPLVDGLSQAPARGALVGFDEHGRFAWTCAQLPDGSAYDGALVQRTVVAAPDYVLDVVQLLSTVGERHLALPWHGLGLVELDEHGVTFVREDGARLPVRLAGRQPFQVTVQRAPGPPAGDVAPAELPFPVVVAAGEEITLAACLDLGAGVEELDCLEDGFVVRLGAGRVQVHRPTDEGWLIELDHGDPVVLGGLREPPEPAAPSAPPERARSVLDFAAGPLRAGGPEAPIAAQCLRVGARPALDGTLAGFRIEAPLALASAEQFRRAEQPWEGAERLSATLHLNHDGDSLFVAADVIAPEPQFRPPETPDPEWENENPDIHSDGLQLYVETPTGLFGWVLVPDPGDPGHVRVAAVRGSDAEPEMVTAAAWCPTPRGYRVTLALDVPDALDGGFGFDACVNRAAPGRERRVGQLVWSGSRGLRLYLAGDRPVPGPLPRVAVR